MASAGAAARAGAAAATAVVIANCRRVRSREEIDWQAGRPLGPPAPQGWKSFEGKVGQTLSSVKPTVCPIASRLLSMAFYSGAGPILPEMLRAAVSRAAAAPPAWLNASSFT